MATTERLPPCGRGVPDIDSIAAHDILGVKRGAWRSCAPELPFELRVARCVVVETLRQRRSASALNQHQSTGPERRSPEFVLVTGHRIDPRFDVETAMERPCEVDRFQPGAV